MSVAYDENKYKNSIDTSYYTNAINKYTQAQEQNRATQTAQAKEQQTSALRDAYISKMQNQKTLNNNLAQAGIRGGATETSNLKIANTYAGQRNSANTDYNNSVNSINQAIDENILNYDMDMTSRAEEYRQNMAQALWQAEREDEANALAQSNWEAEMAYQKERDSKSDEQWQKDYELSQKESEANTANTNANTAATQQSTYAAQWDAVAKSKTTAKGVLAEIKKLKANKSKYSDAEYQYALARLRRRYHNLKNKDK